MGLFRKKKKESKAEDNKDEKLLEQDHPEPSAPPGQESKDYGTIDKKDENDEAIVATKDDPADDDDTPIHGPLPENGSIFSHLFPTQTADQPLPELDPREERAHKTLMRLEHVMDDLITIPGTEKRVGIDPIIGFIPVVGDMASAAVSLVFVSRAAPTLSRYTVARMLVNVGIDSIVGCVPLLGDFFDFGFRANTRNMAIFEDHMKRGVQARTAQDQAWVCRIVVFFILSVTLMCVTTTVLFVLLILWLTGNLS